MRRFAVAATFDCCYDFVWRFCVLADNLEEARDIAAEELTKIVAPYWNSTTLYHECPWCCSPRSFLDWNVKEIA